VAETYQDILLKLKNNQYAPVYFLQGEESFFIDKIGEFIEQNSLEESLKGFNLVVMYGRDTDLSTIIGHAKGYPMMAERKVVIVREAQELSELSKELGETLLIPYLQNPQPSTVLVFCYKYKSIDKRKKLYKAFDNKAVLLNSVKLYDNKIPGWIEGYVKNNKKKIEQNAVYLISENIGNNLTRIANEIDKMLINITEVDTIKVDHVHKYIGISKEYNVFELQKALAFKNVLKANQIIQYFEADPRSNPIILIIANIFAFYNKIMLVHHSSNKSETHLASVLGVNPFFVKEYLMAAKNYTISKVILNIHHIREADLKSKGIDYPSQPEGAILKELVFKLLH